MNLVLAMLMHVIKQYIGEISYNNPEKKLLENLIKNLFKSFNHVYETKNENLESIVTFHQLSIFIIL